MGLCHGTRGVYSTGGDMIILGGKYCTPRVPWNKSITLHPPGTMGESTVQYSTVQYSTVLCGLNVVSVRKQSWFGGGGDIDEAGDIQTISASCGL